MANPLKSLLRQHRGLLVVLLSYCLLSISYNVVSPIFEPPDEATHFRYVKYLLDHKTLPALIDGPNRDELWGLHQPPLAFFFYAVLAAPFELIAPDDYLARNPHVNLGDAHRPGNKNVFIHTQAEAFPYRGLPLLVRALRLFSMLCGVATLAIVYAIGCDLFKTANSRGPTAEGQQLLSLLPPALMALHPEFVFITTEIANEPLNILLMAAGLWACLHLVQHGPSTRLAIMLGVTTGLIAITKMTGLALVLLVVIAMLIAALRGHSVAQVWRFGLIAGALTVIAGGWWYARNFIVYGDPWQAAMYRDFYGDVQRTITLSQWTRGILAGEVSFWAAFGWLNIVVPEWMYLFYKALTRVALVGVGVYVIRWFFEKRRGGGERGSEGAFSPLPPRTLASLLLLLASPLASSLILTRLIATEGGIQGRQLLPMLPALAIIIVVGYRALLLARWFKVVAWGLGVFMAGLTISMPFFYIAPAYAAPPLLAEADLPDNMIRLERSYGEQIQLLGYRLDTAEPVTGQEDSLTLYWRALTPIEQNYTMFVHALGRRMEKVGEYNGYPGGGNFPTSRWPVGPIIQDRVAFIVEPTAEAPTLLRLNVGFFDFERLDLPPLAITDGQGNTVSAQITQQLLVPSLLRGEMCTSLDASVNFADSISLACYEYVTGELRLYWQANAQPQQDYTVFIQFWQDGQQVAGFDGPPFDGDFPASTWRPEFLLRDVHTLDLSQLSPGRYQLQVGLYNPQTGERLPAFDVDGEPLLDYAVEVTVEIE